LSEDDRCSYSVGNLESIVLESVSDTDSSHNVNNLNSLSSLVIRNTSGLELIWVSSHIYFRSHKSFLVTLIAHRFLSRIALHIHVYILRKAAYGGFQKKPDVQYIHVQYIILKIAAARGGRLQITYLTVCALSIIAIGKNSIAGIFQILSQIFFFGLFVF